MKVLPIDDELSTQPTIANMEDIIQLDGNLSDEEDSLLKTLFGIKCETEELVQAINFFRSFTCLWEILNYHLVCPRTLDIRCFLCHMRSSCLRLNVKRHMGPKTLKMVEMVSELNQLQTILGWSWKKEIDNIPKFINNVLSLLQHHESNVANVFGTPNLKCKDCKHVPACEDHHLVNEINTSHLEGSLLRFDLEMILNLLVYKDNKKECCIQSLSLGEHKLKLLIILFSNPIDIWTPIVQDLYGKNFKILSVCNQVSTDRNLATLCHFNVNNQMYHQSLETILKSDNQFNRVKVLCLQIKEKGMYNDEANLQNFMFSTNVQKQMCRQYDQVLFEDSFYRKKSLRKRI